MYYSLCGLRLLPSFLPSFLVLSLIVGWFDGSRAIATSPSATASKSRFQPVYNPSFSIAKDEDEFPPSPLELTEPDPLLPNPDRPLTPAEQQTLSTALDALNLEAAAQLQAGNPVGAFELWNRELRLRRYLGTVAEVEALGRVGESALAEGNFVQLQLVSARLREIEQAELVPEDEDEDEPKPLNLPLLQALGRSYEQVGAPEKSIALYELVLDEARLRGDAVQEEETLNNLARISLQALDYPTAAPIYEKLLQLAIARKDVTNETVYLQQLAYIYDQMRELELTLAQKQKAVGRSTEIRYRLIELNQRQAQALATQLELVDLKLALAADYTDLSQIYQAIADQKRAENQPDLAGPSEALAERNYQLAEQTYRETYVLSWGLQQFSRASEALGKLAELYSTNGQLDRALQVYKTQLDVNQIASDRYGLMIAYDRIGQIYQAKQAYPQALQAYQSAMEIAQGLGDRVAYFTVQIERVRQQLNR
jgi:tetratricopeptide (TPR) repeat protein